MYYFKVKWDSQANEPKPWHVDALVANEVIRPLLARCERDVELWRFHRRAAPGGDGHRFSFHFYSTPATAKTVFASLDSDQLLETLKASGVLERFDAEERDASARGNITDDTEGSWPAEIQKSWPYFIMGVSKMWLELVEQVVQSMGSKPSSSSLDELKEFYERVHAEVTQVWRFYGGHAFLHHLNAVFAYQQLLITPTFSATF